MTLKELAKGLRKVFNFRYLAAYEWYGHISLALFAEKPDYNGITWLWNAPYIAKAELYEPLTYRLDLSEYADENGNIDYSRCIVEVE